MAQNDDFSDLPQAEFDGVVFPITSVRMSHASDAAFHKFPHRPGQIIELTGRAPITGVMVAPMFSGLVFEGNGRTQHWPTGVQLLREKAQQQKLARLVVPTFGVIERAMIRVDESADAAHRDGAALTIQFFEDTQQTIAKGTGPTATARVASFASDLDLQLAALRIALDYKLEALDGGTYVDFATACAGLIALRDNAQASLTNRLTLASRVVGAIDDVFRAIVDIMTDPAGWELREAASNLKAAVIDLKYDTTAAAASIQHYTPAVAMTAAGVARMTRNTVAEVIQLNALSDYGDIPAGTLLVVFAR